MTEVNLVVKVVDKVTAETVKIVGRFRDQMKRAAAATKDFFKNFDAAAFKEAWKGFKELGQVIGALSQAIVALAPNAQTFAATFGPETQAKIDATASSINKVGAAWDTFVGSLVNRGPGAVGILDDLARRLKDAAGIGAVLTERAKLQNAIADAEERFATSTFRERGEYTRLKEEIDAARRALVAYDRAQVEKAANEARAREWRDRAEEQRIRQRNAARGFAEPMTGGALDQYGRVIDQAARDIADLQRISGAAFDEQVARELDGWIEYNRERIDIHRDALDDISEDEIEFSATLERIRQEDLAQEEAALAERVRLTADAQARELAINNAARAREADEWRAYYERRAEENAKIWEQAEAVASEISTRFVNTFDSIIAGTEDVGRAFTRMIGQMIADVGRMMAQESLKKFLTGIVGGLLGGRSMEPQNGGAFDEFGGEISPALFDGQASGGFVRGRSAFMVGERGPEMFVPSTSGNIITAGRSAAGGSIGNVTINVNGATDPQRTAREVKTALMSLMSSDPATRQRFRVVASGGGVA